MRKQILLLLLLTLLFTLLFNCSPRQRFDRLVRKHPELIAMDTTTQIDSAVSIDTAVVDRQLDTAIDYLEPLPLVLTRDRVRLDIRIDSVDKKMYISCQCQDRIITKQLLIREKATVTRTIKAKARDPVKPWWLLWWVLGFASAVLLHSLLRKFLSPK